MYFCIYKSYLASLRKDITTGILSPLKHIKKMKKKTNQEDVKRIKRCILRLTSSEFEALNNIARELGCSKSAYIRDCVFHRKRVFVGKDFLPTYKRICRDSQGIATNINQLAHYANLHKSMGREFDIHIIEQMNTLISEYLQLDKELLEQEKKLFS